MGDATTGKDGLDVGNGSYAKGAGYKGQSLKEKTLVAWARMDDLNLRAGSVLTIDKTDKDEFDGIVYGEREAGKWMAGSDRFARTDNPNPGCQETKSGELIMMAISYAEKEGMANMKLYRNGTKVFIESYPGMNSPPVEAQFRNHGAFTKAAGADQFSSFESIANPGYFLRHTGYILYVHKEETHETYKQDASWKIEKIK